MCNYTQESTHTRQSEPRSRTCNPIVDFVWLALSTILKHGSSGPRDSCKKCMLTVQLAAHKHQDSKNPMRRKQPLLFRWVEVPDFVYHCSTILYNGNEATTWWCKVGDRALARERTPVRVWGGGGPSVLWHSTERPAESPCGWTWGKVEVKLVENHANHASCNL